LGLPSLLLALGFYRLPNVVIDQSPQSHLVFGIGKFIKTHRGLLFFYLSAMFTTSVFDCDYQSIYESHPFAMPTNLFQSELVLGNSLL
jgi:hypothetical protein